MTDEITRANQIDRLTPKQKEVVALVSEGLTSKEIGRKLGISESAVNQRIETIRQRLGGMPRSQIGRIYRRQNTVLVTLPTSNSLTGKPIQLQLGGEAAQTSSAEGATVLEDPGFEETDGVLQPSTFSSSLANPHGLLPRLTLVVAIAVGLAALLVLLLDAADKLGRLIG
jgi:DNA-binding CsgD family transcriptional regulator